MPLRAITIVAAALLVLSPVASRAALSSYTQDFESMIQIDPGALQADGWFVYGNVFSPAHAYLYGYGPFPAPNDGAAFCAVAFNEGGFDQGLQQLSVYNDYNNGDHANGNWIESNVYREQTIGLNDVGTTWVFRFDAKLGNLASRSTAVAFIKTLDQAHGYALTNFITADMTAIPTTWGTYSISIAITPALLGQLLQIGFASTATNYEPSGVFYDNLSFSQATSAGVTGPRASEIELSPAAPNPFAGSTRIEWSLARRDVVELAVFDVTGRRVARLFQGIAEAGPHVAAWDGRCADGRRAAPGVYRCVLQTSAGRQSRSLVLER